MLASPIASDNQHATQPWLRRLRLSRHTQQNLVIAALLVVCYSFFRQPAGWNDSSRYDLVRAIVDNGTFQIDPFHENTGDKAFYDGHYYTSKMPGSSFVGLPVYVVMRGINALAGGPELTSHQIIVALAFFVSGVPTIITVLLLLDVLRTLTGERWALVIAIAYALGTLALPFATMYFGHALSTCFLFASFWTLWRSRDDRSMLMPLLAGFAAGWAALTEMPVVLGVGILLAYCAWQRPQRAVPFVLGGLPALALLLAYNWIAFDHPLRVGYQYSINFLEQNSQGIVSVVLPRWITAVDLLLNPRGLLRISPWLALAPVGLVALRQREHRAPLLVCLAIVVAILTYNSGALAPFGGWTPGPRYLIPALPFAAILVAVVPVVLRPLVVLLAIWSVGIMTIATATVPGAPEFYADPVSDLWIPRLSSHDLAITAAWTNWGLHGLAPLILLAALTIVALVVLWTTTRRTHTKVLAPITALGLLVIALGLLVPVSFASQQPTLTAVNGGATYLHTNDDDFYTIWTQLVNGSTAMNDVTVKFEVLDAHGKQVWAGWHDHFSFRSRQRERVSIEWWPENVAPGTYRLDVSIVSLDQQTTFSYAANVGDIIVHAPPTDE